MKYELVKEKLLNGKYNKDIPSIFVIDTDLKDSGYELESGLTSQLESIVGRMVLDYKALNHLRAFSPYLPLQIVVEIYTKIHFYTLPELDKLISPVARVLNSGYKDNELPDDLDSLKNMSITKSFITEVYEFIKSDKDLPDYKRDILKLAVTVEEFKRGLDFRISPYNAPIDHAIIESLAPEFKLKSEYLDEVLKTMTSLGKDNNLTTGKFKKYKMLSTFAHNIAKINPPFPEELHEKMSQLAKYLPVEVIIDIYAAGDKIHTKSDKFIYDLDNLLEAFSNMSSLKRDNKILLTHVNPNSHSHEILTDIYSDISKFYASNSGYTAIENKEFNY